MVLMSVEPLSGTAGASGNLMPNADLTMFYPGSEVPLGWVSPTEQETSWISRHEMPGQQGKYCLKQIWGVPTEAVTLQDHFKTELIDVEPNTRYVLGVTAVNLSGTSVSVGVAVLDSSGGLSFAQKDLIVVQPGPPERVQYKNQFASGDSGKIVVCTRRNGRTTYEKVSQQAAVLWYDWTLTEVPE